MLSILDHQAGCVDRCAAKNVTLNHKILSAFMTEQPKIQVGLVRRLLASFRFNLYTKYELYGTPWIFN